MSKPEISIESLPKPIAEKLQRAARRIRRIIAWRGLLAVLAAALLVFLVVMAIDAATLIFASAYRWLLSLTGFATVALAAYWHLVRPLRRRLTPAEVARLIETRNQDLREERISSTVEILNLKAEELGEFSESLLRQLIKEAEKDAGTLLPEQVFTWRSARRFLLALSIVGAIYAILFAAWPQPTARLLIRAVAPYARVGGLHADRIAVEPGDIRLAVGDSLTVSVTLQTPFSRNVELRTLDPDGEELIERMRPFDPNAELGRERVFATAFPRVEHSFEYRVRAGRALTQFYRVQAFERPRIENLHLRRQHPPYTGRSPERQTVAPNTRIRALIGSTLTLAIETNTPLQEAELFLDGRSLGAGRRSRSDGIPRLEWTVPITGPARTATWRIEKKSRDGFANRPVVSRELNIVADRPPTVEIVNPRQPRIHLPPDGFLSVQYVAGDDFGISRMALRVRPEGESSRTVEQIVPTPVNGEWRGRVPVDLASLRIGQASLLRIEIVAYDNLPESLDGPNQGVSETLTIMIDRDSQALSHQEVERLRVSAEEALAQVIEELQEISQQTTEMREMIESGDPQNVAEAMAAAAELRRDLSAMEQNLSNLAEQFQDTAFQQLAEGIEAMAEDHIAEARGLAESLPSLDDASERQETAAAMEQELASALEAARELQQGFDPLAAEAEQLADLSAMTNLQEQLAYQAQQEDWPQMQDDWMQRQQEIADQLQAAIDQEMASQQLTEQIQSATQQMQEAAQAAWEASQAAEAAQQAAQAADSPEAAAQQETAQAQQAAAAAAQAAVEAAQAAAEATAQTAETAQQAGMEATAQAVGEVAEAAAQTAQQMAQAALQPDATTPQTMARAAAELQDMAAALQHMTAPAAAEADAMAQAAAEAAQAAAEAAAEGAEGQGEAAAQAGEAASQMQQMTQAMAQQMGLPGDPFAPGQPMPSQPGESPGDESTAMFPESGQVPEWAVDIGLAEGDWTRLRGAVEAEADAVEDGAIPLEYRDLVRRYFRELGERDVADE